MTGLIYCGDGAQWLRGFADGDVDLILTSPPYDNLRKYGGQEFNFSEMADACAAALKPGGVIVWIVADETINGSESGSSFRHALAFMDLGLKLHDTMIWHKCPHRIFKHDRHINAFEYMFVFSKGVPNTIKKIWDVPVKSSGAKMNNYSLRSNPNHDDLVHFSGKPRRFESFTSRSNVWYNCPRSQHECNINSKHPAVFPMSLAKDHVRTWTNVGDLVVDPMCGSGTTVRAAMELERRGFGAEIHPEYAALAAANMRQQVLPLHGSS